MGIFSKILTAILSALPALIGYAEAKNNATATGPSKLQDVLSGIQVATAVAGVVDPMQMALIKGLSTVAINNIVSINNLVKSGTISHATADAAGVLVPAIAGLPPAVVASAS